MPQVPVFSGERKSAGSAVGAAEENLIDADVSSSEGRHAACHVQKPRSVGLFRDPLQDVESVFL